MNELAKLLSDESKIVFANGEAIEGAEKVGRLILKTCEAYNAGYMYSIRKVFIQSLGIGVACGVVIGGYQLVKKNRKEKEI